MPNIYLRHPVFGAKVAISETEALSDMENGWEEFDPTVSEEPKRKGRRKLSDMPNFLASVSDEGD